MSRSMKDAEVNQKKHKDQGSEDSINPPVIGERKQGNVHCDVLLQRCSCRDASRLDEASGWETTPSAGFAVFSG